MLNLLDHAEVLIWRGRYRSQRLRASAVGRGSPARGSPVHPRLSMRRDRSRSGRNGNGLKARPKPAERKLLRLYQLFAMQPLALPPAPSSLALRKPIFFLNAGASVALSDEQLFGKLKQSNLGADDLLFGGHNGVPSNRRGGALRHPDRSASRLGYRCAVDADISPSD